MSDKSKISYWLKEPGDDSPPAVHLLTTECTKVPEVGEVIGIDTKIDREHLIIKHSEINGESLQKFLRSEDKQVDGDFVIVHVKRWFKVFHKTVNPKELPLGLQSNSTSIFYNRFPEEYTVENFEVFIEPFRHTELTETPIAKLRNKMSPIYGYMQVLKAIRDKEIKVTEMGELFEKLQNQAIDSVDDIVDFIKNKDIWK